MLAGLPFFDGRSGALAQPWVDPPGYQAVHCSSFLNGIATFADIGLVTEIRDGGTFVGTPGFAPREGPGAFVVIHLSRNPGGSGGNVSAARSGNFAGRFSRHRS